MIPYLHKYSPLLEEEFNGANVDKDYLQRGEEEKTRAVLDTGFKGGVQAEVDHTHGDGEEEVDKGLHNGGLRIAHQTDEGTPAKNEHLQGKGGRVAYAFGHF